MDDWKIWYWLNSSLHFCLSEQKPRKAQRKCADLSNIDFAMLLRLFPNMKFPWKSFSHTKGECLSLNGWMQKVSLNNSVCRCISISFEFQKMYAFLQVKQKSKDARTERLTFNGRYLFSNIILTREKLRPAKSYACKVLTGAFVVVVLFIRKESS